MTGAVPFRAPDATYSAKAMWLHMYAEGGRWSRAELIDIFGVDAGMDVDLWQMEHARQIRQWGQGRAASWGVTSDCLVPAWVTVHELQQPLQGYHMHHIVASGGSVLDALDAEAARTARMMA